MDLLKPSELTKIRFPVKPSHHLGFILIESPCEFQFIEGKPPILIVNHRPLSNSWTAWGWFIDSLRREEITVNLKQVGKIILDSKKREIGILLTRINEQEEWICVKCRDDYDEIIRRLKTCGNDRIVEGNFKSAPKTMIIVIIVILMLSVIFIIIEWIYGLI